MRNRLFESISPLVVWFWFLQLLAGLCLVGVWIEITHGIHRWRPGGLPAMITLTFLFVLSNVFLFRGRRIGYVGAVLGWLLLVFILLPVP